MFCKVADLFDLEEKEDHEHSFFKLVQVGYSATLNVRLVFSVLF